MTKRTPLHVLACLGLLAVRAPALGQCSPNQMDFGVKKPRRAGSATTLKINGDEWPGSYMQRYDVYMETYPDHCAIEGASPPRTKIANVSTTSYPVQLPPERAESISVVPVGCPYPFHQIDWDSFTQPPAKPTRISATPGASSVTFQITYDDPRAAGMIARRIAPDGSMFEAPVEDHEKNILSPPGHTFTLVDDGANHSGLAPGLYSYQFFVGNARTVVSCDQDSCTFDISTGPSASDPIFVVVGAACPAPAAAPVLTGPSDTPLAGRDALFSWTAVPLADGVYVVETSRDPSFTTILSSLRSRSLTALVPTPLSGADSTLYVCVRAVQGCGTVGPPSNIVPLGVRGSPPALTATTTSVAWSASVGATPPTATIGVKNVGGSSAHVSVLQHGDFFDASPAALDLASGASANVTLTARTAALAAAGGFAGRLELAQTISNHVDIPVTLTVVPAETAGGPKLKASTSTVVFSAPAGVDPPAQTITIGATTGSPSRIGTYLSASVGPGGSWLVLPDSFAGPVASGRALELPPTLKRERKVSLHWPAPL